MLSRVALQIFKGKASPLLSVSRNFTVIRPMMIKPSVKFNTLVTVPSRGYKNVLPKNARRPKTKSGVKKRFIATASGMLVSDMSHALTFMLGALKYGRACKYHMNIGKSVKRLNRLGKKVGLMCSLLHF